MGRIWISYLSNGGGHRYHTIRLHGYPFTSLAVQFNDVNFTNKEEGENPTKSSNPQQKKKKNRVRQEDVFVFDEAEVVAEETLVLKKRKNTEDLIASLLKNQGTSLQAHVLALIR